MYLKGLPHPHSTAGSGLMSVLTSTLKVSSNQYSKALNVRTVAIIGPVEA
jgi:hypothetical protein